IVLDGESTDNTSLEAEAAAQAFGVPDIFLSNPGRTTANGFNLGLALAWGDIIVKVDGHAVVDPSFLSASVASLQASGADAVGGPIATEGRGSVGEAIALALSSPFGVGDAAFRLYPARQAPVDQAPVGLAFSRTGQTFPAGEGRWTDSVPFG